jgi:hypothetical protein
MRKLVVEPSLFKLPLPLRKLVLEYEIAFNCIDAVTRSIQELRLVPYDPYIGYSTGLMEVLQNKEYVAINICAYDAAYKRDAVSAHEQHIFPHCSLVLHYLRQEADFNTKYPAKREAPHLNGR